MNQMTLCLLLFALMIVLFFIKKIPMSFSAMLIVVLLVVTGCVEVQNCAEFFWQLNGCHYGFYVRGSCGSDPYSDDQSDIPAAV